MWFGLSFDRAEELVRDGLILPSEQTFQAPGGATTKKIIYKYYYNYAYKLAVGEGDPKLLPARDNGTTDKKSCFSRFRKLEFRSGPRISGNLGKIQTQLTQRIRA
jgi:hypothetical protein